MEETITKTPETIMIHPLTLNEGKDYLLRVHQDNGHNLVYLPVRFINYHPCPAIVVVSDGNGQFRRLPRDDVFSVESIVYQFLKYANIPLVRSTTCHTFQASI